MPQVGLICLAGRHDLFEALRKDELHLGKLKGARGSGVGGQQGIHPTPPGVADKNNYLPGGRGPALGQESCSMREALSVLVAET